MRVDLKTFDTDESCDGWRQCRQYIFKRINKLGRIMWLLGLDAVPVSILETRLERMAKEHSKKYRSDDERLKWIEQSYDIIADIEESVYAPEPNVSTEKLEKLSSVAKNIRYELMFFEYEKLR